MWHTAFKSLLAYTNYATNTKPNQILISKIKTHLPHVIMSKSTVKCTDVISKYAVWEAHSF